MNQSEPVSSSQVRIEELVHLSLQIGRLLLANGADTTQVRDAVERFAAALGHEVRLVVTYEEIMLTTVGQDGFRTKVGLHLPAMNVDMSAVGALNEVVDDAVAGRLDAAGVRARLTTLEHARAVYPRWVTAIGVGLTAASLAKLFGGDWSVFFIAFIAGTAGTSLRQQLGRWHFNPVLAVFVTALFSGVIGGLGMRLHSGSMPALCLVAPGMIIVPGVPLINGIRDAINNHMNLSLARLAFGAVVIMAIAFGLFIATLATGVGIPVSGRAVVLPILTDAIFSALAAAGYVFLFNVPVKDAWACILCGMSSHTLRTAVTHLGVDIVTGTLIGSLTAGFMAQGFARYFKAPPATFAFPGVVALVPGSYAFRAVIGCLQVMQAGSRAPAELVAETFGLIVSCILLTATIGVGIAVPLAAVIDRRERG
jgi:uncharacterized membrane protein YjjP (DUF1212 family)